MNLRAVATTIIAAAWVPGCDVPSLEPKTRLVLSFAPEGATEAEHAASSHGDFAARPAVWCQSFLTSQEAEEFLDLLSSGPPIDPTDLGTGRNRATIVVWAEDWTLLVGPSLEAALDHRSYWMVPTDSYAHALSLVLQDRPWCGPGGAQYM